MKLYKGRIPSDPEPLMDDINRSLPFDLRLLPDDVRTNRAWAGELTRLGVYTDSEHVQVCAALDEIAAMFDAGTFASPPADEDVHTLVERLLTERLGDLGARIHTGRSRNDQVVTDLRLWARDRLIELDRALLEAIGVLRDRACEHAATLMAGTTHLQPALPITLGHFLLSSAFALKRDIERLRDTARRVDLCPLGSGAMAGSGFPVDRAALAEALGFAGVLENTIDAVSDRDFCQEIAAACAILCGHLSRYAEQFVIWANPAFGYVRFADAWSTGSSMMPQKRNPDAMELIRGKAARVIGGLTTLLTMTKGLPLTYAKDLQEDKEPLFDILDTTLLVVRVFARAVKSAEFQPRRLMNALRGELLATDLADALARAGVPFRQAHERVARLVGELESAGKALDEVEPPILASHFPEFGEAPPRLGFREAIDNRRVEGGPSAASIKTQLQKLDQLLGR